MKRLAFLKATILAPLALAFVFAAIAFAGCEFFQWPDPKAPGGEPWKKPPINWPPSWPSPTPPRAPVEPRPEIPPTLSIRLNGIAVENNAKAVFLRQGESIVFEIAASDFGSLEKGTDLFDGEHFLFTIDPLKGGLAHPGYYNSAYFSINVRATENASAQIMVTRNDVHGVYHNGIAPLFLRFNHCVEIEGESGGYIWNNTLGKFEKTDGPGNFVVINLTTESPESTQEPEAEKQQ
ncbi:MAG: hypothetical protein FWE09_04770 [Treponema sp.]|nr:hypothetical protein [Treponema sp.]